MGTEAKLSQISTDYIYNETVASFLLLLSSCMEDRQTSAIERLYFSERLRLGGAVLPRDRIRSYLHLLSPDTLVTALDVLRRNRKPVRNTIAYAMSVIFNGIAQQFSDLLVCLPPEYQGDEEYADEQLPKGAAGAPAADRAASLRGCTQDPAPYFSGAWASA